MRIIISSIIIIAIGIINYLYGNAISIFFSICITASLIYFIQFLRFENKITNEVKRNSSNNKSLQSLLKNAAEISKKQRALSNFFLLTIVFIASIFCIKITSGPTGNDAYFFNTDHHAIAHKYTYFSNPLTYQLQSDIPSILDSNYTERTIQFIPQNDKITLQTNQFLHPIFRKENDDRFHLINKVFPKEITDNFTLIHPYVEITIRLEDKHSFWRKFIGKKPIVLYSIQIKYLPRIYNEENLSTSWLTDSFSFYGTYLQQGLNLYNLLLDNEYIQEPNNESILALQEILHSINESYLIAEHSKEKDVYYFFPDKEFFNQNLQLKINNEFIKPITSQSIDFHAEDEFYIGFNNKREKLKITSINQAESSFRWAIEYDHPPYYWLSVPDFSNFKNNKISFYVTNNFDQVIDYPKNEIFYFNNYGLKTKETFEGVFQYIIDNTQVPLQYILKDVRKNTEEGLQLSSENKGISYGFELRNFAENGFSFSKMIIYASIIYISFLLFLLFFPGKNLGRIEAVIFVVIYALFVLRMLMYWRLATFPPVENISKYELENTLLNFDFNLGITLPIPLTLVWLIVFLITLAIIRKFKTSVKEYLASIFNKVKNISAFSENKTFIIGMGMLLLAYILNDKILHIEPLTRILAIIAPITFYLLYTIKNKTTFTLEQKWAKSNEKIWKRELKAYFYYLVNNPAFIPSIVTLIYFGITDRGFGVLFFLFLLLKNILLNFLKKSYNSSTTAFWKMLIKPNNFWIYGIIALIVYMIILSIKSLFYHILQNYIWVVGGVFFLIWLFFILFLNEKKKLIKISSIFLGLYIILLSIPFTRTIIDDFVVNQIKHVQYRMSIIYQPISDLLLENEYSSFNSRKIIETAENQWFINSYISKEYNPEQTLNLRPYNKVGVDYNTQTRDVVLARFVISEMGNTTMYMILLLMALPLILYLIGFKFTDLETGQTRIDKNTYVGIVPLILFFTICLFVWLTSTNRFVFFGQDFPFLSLTSRTSMVLPLILLGITLLSSPKIHIAEKVSLQRSFSKYILFVGMIAFFALVTVQPNTLNTQNFSIVVHKTQDKIENELNAYLETIQDSLSNVNSNYSYIEMIQALKKDDNFQNFMNDSLEDAYTKSIFSRLMNLPYTAFEIHSPIYIQHDGYRFRAMYNQNFYLELPAIDNNNVWRGNIVEDLGNIQKVILKYGDEQNTFTIPYFKNDIQNNLHLAILPKSWLANSTYNIGIIDVVKTKNNSTNVSVYKDYNKTFTQRSISFASSILVNEIVTVKNNTNNFTISLLNAAPSFAINKWVNGKYRILFPHRPKNLWIYNFAHGIKTVKNEKGAYQEDLGIGLDFDLNKKIEKIIHDGFQDKKKNKKFKFAVIAADGDGNIRLMQDFVSNRKDIDPNDLYTIYRLRQKNFFFNNIRNERDQWGEANLLNMQLGPGSSIKPLSAAIIASQVNAGWEHLILSPPVQPEYNYYAGFKLLKPWKNDDHYFGNINLATYIEASSNFYQSVMLFLGSYPKEAFIKNGKASLSNVLSHNATANNTYPSMDFLGSRYFFSDYNKGKNNWPATNVNDAKKSYFGNENSIIANGLEINANLITKDKEKNNPHYGSMKRNNIIDTGEFTILKEAGNAYYLWSMPEENSFFQKLRAPLEIHQNINIGLKTATLGGYPYQLSTFKMLEMYSSLFTQNRNFRLHLTNNKYLPNEKWHIDETWGSQIQFNTFLSQNIFTGMHQVIYGGAGTLKRMSSLKSQYPQYYFYAKTGTINEQGSGELSSRRLLLAISNKDLTKSENIGNSKVYLIYFMIDRNKDFDWNIVNQIITEVMNSTSLKLYFNS